MVALQRWIELGVKEAVLGVVSMPAYDETFAGFVTACVDAGVGSEAIEMMQSSGVASLRQARVIFAQGACQPQLQANLAAVVLTAFGPTVLDERPRQGAVLRSEASAMAKRQSQGIVGMQPAKMLKGDAPVPQKRMDAPVHQQRKDVPVPQLSKGGSLKKALEAATPQNRAAALASFQTDIWARSNTASQDARCWLVRSEAKHGKRLVVALNTVCSVEAFAARRVCKG